MQNPYVGDIGDYVKLGILRALSPGYRLGVAWWLFPDEAHNQYGQHIEYLGQPEKWRQFDPQLFDALAKIVSSGQRDVRALEASNILPGAVFANEVIPVGGTIADRPLQRRKWFETVQRTLEGADLAFLDPDAELSACELLTRLGQGWQGHHDRGATRTVPTKSLPDRVSPSNPEKGWSPR